MIRETACRQFPAGEVVRNALTTDTLAAAGFIAAIAFFLIGSFFTIHPSSYTHFCSIIDEAGLLKLSYLFLK